MKLSVSNLAWLPEAEDEARRGLVRFGATGVEVAPTRLGAWDELSDERLKSYRRGCSAMGLSVSSLQAIFFGKPEAQLLGDEPSFEHMREHFKRIVAIGHTLGAGPVVFGAPKSRLRLGRAPAEAFELASVRLSLMADLARDGDLTIAVEPVPTAYGGEFLNSFSEVQALVEAVAHPNLRPHLDVACVALGGDDIVKAVHTAASTLAHFHISETDLAGFESASVEHGRAAAALRAADYRGWVCIEKLPGAGSGLPELEAALAFAANVYGCIAAA